MKRIIENLVINFYKSEFIKKIYKLALGVPIIGLIISKVFHFVYPKNKKIWIKIPDGVLKGYQLYVDPRTETGYLNGDHEPWIQKLLSQELNNGDCFYDIGAHKGFFSLIAKIIVGKEGHVFSFEPDPDNAYVFKKILDKNNINQISIIGEGVHSISGKFLFKKAPADSNLTQGYIEGTNSQYDTRVYVEHISISTTSLDDFVYKQGHLPPNMIKIDVEGTELFVLIGAKRMLKEYRPKLLIEIHNKDEVGAFNELLGEFDYNIHYINPKHVKYKNYKQDYIIAFP